MPLGGDLNIKWGWQRPSRAELLPSPEIALGEWEAGGTREARVLPGAWIAWEGRGTLPTHPEGMMGEFLGLASLPDEDVLSFARRWGTLGLCNHLLPSGHATHCEPMGHQFFDAPELHEWQGLAIAPLPFEDFDFWEPVEALRHYARQFRSILTVAFNLTQGRPGDPGDWLTMSEWHESRYHEPDRIARRAFQSAQEASPEQPARVRQEQEAVADIVTALLRVSEHRPKLVWNEGQKPKLEAASGVFGALAMQVGEAVTNERIATCNNCGRVYAPRRRARADRDSYCPNCTDARRVAYRRRKQDTRGDAS